MFDSLSLSSVSFAALQTGTVSATSALQSLARARQQGLRAPVVMFGYYNTFRVHGLAQFALDAHKAGADAILCVDLPPEELLLQLADCPLSLVPLVTPTTSPERIRQIADLPNVAFLYCVALLGVTGARSTVTKELPEYMARVSAQIAQSKQRPPTVVGFGISSRESFVQVAATADGVVVASAMLDAVLADPDVPAQETVLAFARKLTGRSEPLPFPPRDAVNSATAAAAASPSPSLTVSRGPGWYGSFGGAFIPETLRFAVDELSEAFEKHRQDPQFWADLRSYDSYVGRPTPLHECPNLRRQGGPKIWLKREDLSHTGAHKINNALGQALLAKRIGKNKVSCRKKKKKKKKKKTWRLEVSQFFFFFFFFFFYLSDHR